MVEEVREARGGAGAPATAALARRLGLPQATALNMANMVGVGPFLTIPFIVKELPGPQVIVAWALGLAIALSDAMVWCELGAALPGSGGTYHYLKEAFSSLRWARILPFLFIWQFIFSGPLEVATGCIGFVQYLDVLRPADWPALTFKADEVTYLTLYGKVAATLLVFLAVALLYRRIDSVGKLTVALWAGMIVTVLLVIAAAFSRFDGARAFTFPTGAVKLDWASALALGAALRIAMYDFLGYYDICYLGDEVRDPARTIPRAVVVSVFAVAAIYSVMNIGILGALPVAEVTGSSAIASDVVARAGWGPWAVSGITLLILWTAFASVFALVLGYSRIPFAAARAGDFFRVFGDLHPVKGFPRVSLIVVGAATAVACWFPFQSVLDALLTSRIPVQFMAQIGAVVAIRRLRPDVRLPFRMWLFPAPCLIALGGWSFILATSGGWPLLYAGLTLAAGVLAFLVFEARKRGLPIR